MCPLVIQDYLQCSGHNTRPQLELASISHSATRKVQRECLGTWERYSANKRLTASHKIIAFIGHILFSKKIIPTMVIFWHDLTRDLSGWVRHDRGQGSESSWKLWDIPRIAAARQAIAWAEKRLTLNCKQDNTEDMICLNCLRSFGTYRGLQLGRA